MTLTIGELCAGYGGLGMAVEEVFGARLAWVSEYEAAPSKILAHHWPDVPNLGDMTRIDWAAVEPVDIISGGTPCQDLSHAGKRAGMTEGTRSNLWVQMREAIATIRPRFVVWENVRGAYSAAADSDVEPCPGCVGDGPGVHLRALGRVLGDLSELGYDSAWHGLTAASVGAPHGRFRVFVLAWLARDADSPNATTVGGVQGGSGTEPGGTRSDDRCCPTCGRPTANAGCDSGEAGRQPAPGQADRGWASGDTAGRGGTRSAADANGAGREGRERLEGPGARRVAGRDWVSDLLAQRPSAVDLGRTGPGGSPRADVNWGPYRRAIRTWEEVVGPAPAPTEVGPKGRHRLSPRFVEWMQGVTAGHVTDVPGISRNDQLKALGNGVVPQQAAAALRHILSAISDKAAA